jgi:hypothetical protein
MAASSAAEAQAGVEATAVVAASSAAQAEATAGAAAEAAAQVPADAEAQVSLQLLLERWGSCECRTAGCSTYMVFCAGLEQSWSDDSRAVMQQQTHCCMSHVRI